MLYPKKDKIELVCEECGTHVKVYPYKIKTFRFCSQKCKYSHIRRTMLRRQSKIKSKIISCICQNVFCKNVFYVKSCYKRPYCCRRCFYETRKRSYQQRIDEMKEQEEMLANSLHKSIWRL